MASEWAHSKAATTPWMSADQWEQTRASITGYFALAWASHIMASAASHWMERSRRFNDADSYLYQAIGLAGLRWPWSYRLPRGWERES